MAGERDGGVATSFTKQGACRTRSPTSSEQRRGVRNDRRRRRRAPRM